MCFFFFLLWLYGGGKVKILMMQMCLSWCCWGCFSVFIWLIPLLMWIHPHTTAVCVTLFLAISILTSTVYLISFNSVREQYCVKSAWPMFSSSFFVLLFWLLILGVSNSWMFPLCYLQVFTWWSSFISSKYLLVGRVWSVSSEHPLNISPKGRQSSVLSPFSLWPWEKHVLFLKSPSSLLSYFTH